MALWAKIDVDMPADGKLLGQPVVTRHLWTCLICLAKKQDEGGAIRGYDCALLSGAFNLPRKAVAAALTYFQGAQMVELDIADGTIRLVNFLDRQGPEDTSNERSKRYYESHRENILGKRQVSRGRSHGSLTVVSRETVSLEQNRTEVEQKKEERDLAESVPKKPEPLPPPTAFTDYIGSAFPTCKRPGNLEGRAREAWPGVDILTEAKKARVWEEANPTKIKRNKAAFLARWFDKAQERTGPRQNGTPIGNGADKGRAIPTPQETRAYLDEQERVYQEGRWKG